MENSISNKIQTVANKLLNTISDPGFIRDCVIVPNGGKGFTKEQAQAYQGAPDLTHSQNRHWGFSEEEQKYIDKAWQLLIDEGKIVPVEGDLWKLAENTHK